MSYAVGIEDVDTPTMSPLPRVTDPFAGILSPTVIAVPFHKSRVKLNVKVLP